MNWLDVDFSKIYLVPEKKGGYRVTYNMSKLKLITPAIYIPFGVENFNGKDILNLEVQKKTNDGINFINTMNTFDRIYHQFSDKSIIDENNKLPFVNIPQFFPKEMSGKSYVTFFKPSSLGRIVRTHLGKNTEIYKIIDGAKIPVSFSELKGKNAICEIELNNLWIYGVTYGLVWGVSKIIVQN
jgi:hypothetical protein